MTYVRSKPGAPGDAAGPTVATALAEPAASRREIAREHRQIRSLVAQVEAIADLEELVPRLNALRALLEVHFAREEAPGGLHQVVDGTAPRLATSVEALFDEHREMLALLDAATRRARECLEGPITEVRRAAAELCRRLHEHEAAETDLLAGALYEDIGGGD